MKVITSHFRSRVRSVVFSSIALLLSSGVCHALQIEIGQHYQAIGTPQFYDVNGDLERSPLEAGSSFRFGSDGVFYLNLVTALGTASLEFGYDLTDFNDGGDVRLRPATEQSVHAITNHLNSNPGLYVNELDTDMDGALAPIDVLYHINDLNAGVTSDTWKQVGIFNPGQVSPNWLDFSFIAAMMDGVFRLDSPDNSFTLWNGQFSPDGDLIGRTDFWLSGGPSLSSEIPEPTTVLLFGSGLLGCLLRRSRNCSSSVQSST